MNLAAALPHTAPIDFQRISTRTDEACALMDEVERSATGFIPLCKTLRRLKPAINRCLEASLQEDYKKHHLSMLLGRMLEVYLFNRWVLKTHAYDHYLETLRLPNELRDELQKDYAKASLENGAHQAQIAVPKGSAFDTWIRTHYLALARKMFRGVFGYSAHVRYVYNQPGITQAWEKRYFTPHANYHWDHDLNSLTTVIYLSDAKASDGAFRVIPESRQYRQNLYLSFYDRFLSNTRPHALICGDQIGSFLETLPPEKEHIFAAPAGSVIQFYGRHILHDGGYPDPGGARIAIFVDQRNFIMKPLRKLTQRIAVLF